MSLAVGLFVTKFPVLSFMCGTGLIFSIAAFLRSSSSDGRDFLWESSKSIIKFMREKLIASEMVSTIVIIDGKSYLRIPYIHDNFCRYVMLLPITKSKLGKTYRVIPDNYTRKYLGPTAEIFHGIPTTPRMLGLEALIVNYDSLTKPKHSITYNIDDVILGRPLVDPLEGLEY